MDQTSRRHSVFEFAVVVFLVLLSCWPAISFSAAGLLAPLHAASLIIVYLLVRLLVGRLNKWVGKFVFSISVLMLLADLLVQQVTGLHLNPFVLSVMMQPGISNELGVPVVTTFASIAALLALGVYAARKLKLPAFVLQGRSLLLMGAAAAVATQLFYGLMYFYGAAEIEEVRRKLPFFAAPHPYYSKKALGFVLNADTDNPFALATTFGPSSETPEQLAKIPSFKGPKKNVLLVVVDSLRSQDIAGDASLVPNITRWGQQGQLSFGHYSVSNCTHFSFYSLLTGTLPTGFGRARRGGRTVGILPAFAANNYRLSTAESNSLGWYDTADILFPKSTSRFVSQQGGSISSDADVTRSTVETLTAYKANSNPFFHLAYYFGPHYPYDASIGSENEGNFEKYKHTIRTVDAEIGALLDWVSTSGLLKDTIVIVTSDHGEEFERSGRTGHATRLSNEQIKVPFLLIDQTEGATSTRKQFTSHLGIAPYLLAQVNGAVSPPAMPTILANCSYDYPSAFAVIEDNWRADFSYENGYLTPVYSPDGTLAAPARQLQAAAVLVNQIKKAP